MTLDTLPTTRPDSQVPATRGEGEVGGTELSVGKPTFKLTNLPPPDAGELGQPEGVRMDQFEHDNTVGTDKSNDLDHFAKQDSVRSEST